MGVQIKFFSKTSKPKTGKNIVCRFVLMAMLGICLVSAPVVRSEVYGDFRGWKACAECHAELTDGWLHTKHAGAYEVLKKSDQHHLPVCIRCHVVGYDVFGGFIDEELTPELAGVQCEACHGPGRLHAKDPDTPGAIQSAPGEGVCRNCHTKEQDSGFDFSIKERSVHGDDNIK